MPISFSHSFSQPVTRDWRRRSVRRVDGQMDEVQGAKPPRVRNAIPFDRDREPSEWQPVGETANTETMVAAHTRSQRACSRQRVSTMTLLLAPRQLGSQGGSSSTLSQFDSTRDLVRFTRPRARTCYSLRSASHHRVLLHHLRPGRRYFHWRKSERWTDNRHQSERLVGVCPVETLVGLIELHRQVIN